jgi:acetyl-CoA carboxylase biotin carboxylase subunit
LPTKPPCQATVQPCAPGRVRAGMFTKVLVANRGEIAIRVMRALEEMEIASVGVYSELDRDALHVARADESYLLGPGPAAESYLKIEKILEVASQSGAEAVHPGYGFLAENAAFAQACADAGITFIGPPAAAIEAMGSKTAARALMQKAGVPIVPGTTEPVPDLKAARKLIDQDIGYPVAVKAAGGGGGKGFRVALSQDELEEAFEGAAREGEKFFSDPTVYLERYLPDPRHVEVQVLADTHGNVIHLGERDCSVQRRHQKLIEEAPSVALTEDLRKRMGEAAVKGAKAIDYVGAGTIEMLLNEDKSFYFMEMNTRIQVEHPVTEMLTGVDLVKEQILVASGAKLSVKAPVERRGHVIECRVNAEDPARNFQPSPGRIDVFHPPGGPGVRLDTHVYAGYSVPPFYDSLLAKLICQGRDRPEALRRMQVALESFIIEGVTTTIPFLARVMANKHFQEGAVDTKFLERESELMKEPVGAA